jgi:hypothetical protein
MDEDGAKYQQVARLQYTEIERLHAELGQLRTENRRLLDWIMGKEPDALTALQRVYSDPKTNENNRIKAAASALPFERSKPASVSVVIDFKERVRNARLRQLELDRQEWARTEPKLDLDAPTPPTILGQAEGHESSIQFAAKRDGAHVPEAEDEDLSPDPAA